ncbi:protease inhibitor Inh/omp19 family protein [Nitratireductor sp. XY-223]|uniref:protease inhibitor Inh/omp19 family protein n=1 Tax=Nitratireductor sp. XY-223 TaxID=2561926 RepID=UPI0010AAA007|nr:protease inhibitor Inh/omp19 family protein [Nitratireductor sp. XY-223]
MRNGIVVIALCATVAVAGCQRTGFGGGFGQPSPLSPAPVGDIQSGQLPPAGQSDFPDAPTTQGPSEQELQAVAANAPEVTRDSMVGRWTISTGGNSCDVFLALTKWTGGYRAASRGCNDQAALISAWDVQGKQVILNDSSGNQFAALYKSGEQRFDGTTAAGQPISLNR